MKLIENKGQAVWAVGFILITTLGVLDRHKNPRNFMRATARAERSNEASE